MGVNSTQGLYPLLPEGATHLIGELGGETGREWSSLFLVASSFLLLSYGVGELFRGWEGPEIPVAR
jgi:hypothetical protein